MSTSGLSRIADGSVVIRPSARSIALDFDESLTRTPLSSMGQADHAAKMGLLLLYDLRDTAAHNAHSEQTDSNGVFRHDKT